MDGDLTRHTGTWTLKEFYSQFSELYSWLNSVQETIYGKEENITDKALRAVSIQIILIMLRSAPSIAMKPFNATLPCNFLVQNNTAKSHEEIF